MSKNLLILFVKNLIPGTVKTRLASEIGMEGALDVYQFLVEHTFEETNELEECDKIVYYSEYVEIEDVFDNGRYQMQVQKGVDLGARMQNAFQKSFDAGYDKAVIIGSDCFELKKEHIDEAFASLDDNDIIVGPAKDGGYYLLGIKELYPALFTNKTFSHENVLKELLAEIASLDLSFHLLAELNDIDTLDDLKDSDIDFEFVSEED